MFNKNKMIHKITFLLQHKKNASSYRFSKQLKNLQSNLLIGGFISIIYSSFASSLRAEGPKAPEARPERAKAQKQHALKEQKQHALKTQKFPETARPVLPHTP